ncbi:hypothetical protein ATN84_03575 [Paramesorhizobium deserti]|uniref:Uncharacterized protein n=1 Tax=Paramesorhizobium deserti TaxID=1494590 RepID=A0A135I071_9HYPH|nr:hypothetical protein [Paramesorhizobium deserti]KXF78854.1 hypothetical protein ATN84_03575 [Paramesorhizobium deserti]
MVRFMFRALAVAALALAVIFAVLDAARSIGASKFIATPFVDIWTSASPQTLADAKALTTHYISALAWDPVLVWMLDWPAWLILGVLALIFYAVGHRRERGFGRFAAN